MTQVRLNNGEIVEWTLERKVRSRLESLALYVPAAKYLELVERLPDSWALQVTGQNGAGDFILEQSTLDELYEWLDGATKMANGQLVDHTMRGVNWAHANGLTPVDEPREITSSSGGPGADLSWLDLDWTKPTEARLLVNTSLTSYGHLLDGLGLAAGARRFAEEVAENATLLAALEANGWQLEIDEFDSDQVYLCGVKHFATLDQALAAARLLPGAVGRTLGWGIGAEDADEYLPVDGRPVLPAAEPSGRGAGPAR